MTKGSGPESDSLTARLAAMRDRAAARDRDAQRRAYVGTVPLLSALEECGDDYDSYGYAGLPVSLNRWAHDPHRASDFVDSDARYVGDDTELRMEICALLRDHLPDDQPCLIILRREALVIACRLHVILRHISTLLANADGDVLAFTTAAADWILTVERAGGEGGFQIVTGRPAA